MEEVQKHLGALSVSWASKTTRDFMQYFYDDPRAMYPQFLTAAHKAESEYKDNLGKGAYIKLAEDEGKDEIMTLGEQITQLRVVKLKPQVRTTSDNPMQSGNRNSENRNVNNTRENGNGQNQHERHNCSKVKCFHWRDGNTWPRSVQAKIGGRLQIPPTFLLGCTTEWRRISNPS